MLDKRVALVTGASRGIGAASAKLLAANHAAVAVNFHSSEGAAREVVEEIIRAGGRAIPVQADVRVATQVTAMVQKVERELGPIDILVSNAAIGFPMKPFVEQTWDEFSAKLNGELQAAFNCVQAVVPSMRARRSGSIIAISSTLSRHAGPGFSAHSTAKSGLDGLVRALALELGPLGIRVNVVAPGLTATDATAGLPDQVKQYTARSTPLGRIGNPEDVAGAILMLASDQARFVTGTYLPVNGGAFML
jgi:3-oxoacyl-[acyl-carrier protein] reductase